MANLMASRRTKLLFTGSIPVVASKLAEGKFDPKRAKKFYE
jgi:hypothetical protein